ncbi:MAG: ABC transporter substrate-binding protein [Anaerolineae bacterium]|nr:ABC transporter substrate-binding protein [Anaerolineae bacterium]
MRFLRICLLIVLLGSVIVFSVDAQNNSGKGLTIGFSQVGSESAWRLEFTRAIKVEAQERGINLLFLNAENSQKNQITALRSFINDHVDAIILAPVIETGWDQILHEAQDAGIPVVIIDRNVTADESLYLTRVSSDFVYEGRLAAVWLAQATAGKKCKIIELEGTVGSSAARDRQIGFNDVLKLFPDMQIIFSQSGDFIRQNGKKIMDSILKTEDPTEICAVWSHNDDMAIGAIQAIKDAGMKPGKDILIVSVDATPDIFKAMADGDANATIELSPYLGGPAFDAIIAHLQGEDIPKWIPVTGKIYFPDTAAAEYAKRQQ